MWEVVPERRDLIKHGLGVLLLIMFPQRLPVRPDDSVVTQRASQALVNVRQQMQVTYVLLVKDKRAERTSEVDASRAVLLRLLLTLFQVTLHLKLVINERFI